MDESQRGEKVDSQGVYGHPVPDLELPGKISDKTLLAHARKVSRALALGQVSTERAEKALKANERAHRIFEARQRRNEPKELDDMLRRAEAFDAARRQRENAARYSAGDDSEYGGVRPIPAEEPTK